MNRKKVAFFVLLFALLCIMSSSCNKRYTCARNGIATEIFYSKDYTPSQLAAFDTACVHSGGYWEIYQ